MKAKAKAKAKATAKQLEPQYYCHACTEHIAISDQAEHDVRREHVAAIAEQSDRRVVVPVTRKKLGIKITYKANAQPRFGGFVIAAHQQSGPRRLSFEGAGLEFRFRTRLRPGMVLVKIGKQRTRHMTVKQARKAIIDRADKTDLTFIPADLLDAQEAGATQRPQKMPRPRGTTPQRPQTAQTSRMPHSPPTPAHAVPKRSKPNGLTPARPVGEDAKEAGGGR